MTTPFRWGIIAPGSIAKQFAHGLAAIPDAVLVAVGARDITKATAFATEFSTATNKIRAHGSYAALAADPNVDAVYIASPHPFHREHALLCIAHGKAVLCEKPFAVNHADAAEIVAAAKAKGVFCMEALWTRFLPATARVRAWLADSRIGEVRMVCADFGFRCGWDPTSRLLDPNLAGGALLDVGCYGLAYARMIFGTDPLKLSAVATLGDTGVDEQIALSALYAQGRLASLTAAVRTSTNHDAWIYGTSGRIHVPGYWHARSATLIQDGQAPVTATPEFVGNGYNYEAVEVAACVRAGRTQSALAPLAESLETMQAMDEARRQVGLSYPGEQAPGEKSQLAHAAAR